MAREEEKQVIKSSTKYDDRLIINTSFEEAIQILLKKETKENKQENKAKK